MLFMSYIKTKCKTKHTKLLQAEINSVSYSSTMVLRFFQVVHFIFNTKTLYQALSKRSLKSDMMYISTFNNDEGF